MMITQKSIEKVKLSYNRFFTIQFCTSMIFIFFMAFSSQELCGIADNSGELLSKGSQLSAHTLKLLIDGLLEKTEFSSSEEDKEKIRKLLLLKDSSALIAHGLQWIRGGKWAFPRTFISLGDFLHDFSLNKDEIEKPIVRCYGALHLCDYLASMYTVLLRENNFCSRNIDQIIENTGFAADILHRFLEPRDDDRIGLAVILGFIILDTSSLVSQVMNQESRENYLPINNSDSSNIFLPSHRDSSNQETPAPSIYIDTDRNNREIFRIELAYAHDSANRGGFSMERSRLTNGLTIQDLRLTDEESSMRDIVRLQCGVLAVETDLIGRTDCPSCGRPRILNEEAILHFNPNAVRPQQMQWRNTEDTRNTPNTTSN